MARGRRASTALRRRNGNSSSGVARSNDDPVPEVFRDMLEIETVTDPTTRHSTKKRRVGSKAMVISEENEESLPNLAIPGDDQADDDANYPVQTTFDSDDDSEDNFEWEDVNLDIPMSEQNLASHAVSESLSIVVSSAGNALPTPSKRKTRKPPTNAERKMRLDIHKVHFLCLLYHCLIRNHWCNDAQLQVNCVEASKATLANRYRKPSATWSRFHRNLCQSCTRTYQQASFRDLAYSKKL
jgi:xeroderma pigmentosum group C-complementing protein